MTLSSLPPLMRIESANTAAFCCLHRLTIHDDNRWTSTSTGLNSRHLVKSSLHLRPNPCIAPTPKVVIHPAPDPTLAEASPIDPLFGADTKPHSPPHQHWCGVVGAQIVAPAIC